MTSKAFLCAILLGGLHTFVAAPAIHRPRSSSPPMLVPMEPRSGWGSQEALSSEPDNAHVDDIGSLVIAPHTGPTIDTKSTIDIPNYPYSFSYISPPSKTSAAPAVTVTVTEEESITITASASPTTVTEVITITYSASASSSAPPPTPSSPPVISPGPSKAIWVVPKNFSDLDTFQVSRYSGGKKNIKIVTGIPAAASATAHHASSKLAGARSQIPWDNAGAVMQLLYPAHSIDPAKKPQGGADFYAAPLDISEATNVTLQYSVFFPADFDWVLAGKLPGLYGGHTGCSGGNAAKTCFSTRLMWRQEGAGELYLYAPKDKQTTALCDDPQSSCDAAYGLSIGRGAFKYAAGSWTTVQQTVTLNTPGKQDGSFVLHVNGERKIERNDVFYREDLSGGKSKPKTKTKTKTKHAPSKTRTRTHEKPTSTSTDDGDDDPLGPILGGILGGLRRRAGGPTDSQAAATTTIPTNPGVGQSAALYTTPSPQPTPTDANAFGTEAVKQTEVKLIGIFFSTFFGGHEEKYATPRDQYVWFKDFALAYNA